MKEEEEREKGGGIKERDGSVEKGVGPATQEFS